MKTAAEIAAFIAGQAEMTACLREVESLSLPDCWIGAGFVRNAVWDALHARPADVAQLSDIDVVFFDAADASAARDHRIERQLLATIPRAPWSVKNQARMHVRNGDLPYTGVADAISRWPETATAIAARWTCGRVELVAPHGVADLLGLIVRPTPAFLARRADVAQRVTLKGWKARWPQLTIAGV